MQATRHGSHTWTCMVRYLQFRARARRVRATRSRGHLQGYGEYLLQPGEQKMDLVIRNGTIVTADAVVSADVGIEGGKVKQIGKALGPAGKEIDAGGKYLFPGGVDVHTHVDFTLLGRQGVED